jgi:ubiquitin-like domain-containing CTD phosphatase 1
MLRILSPYYDYVIWSQTHWRWLEQKLIELDMVGPSKKGSYNIVSTLDRTPMFSVYSEKGGKPYKHEVKVRPTASSILPFPHY